MTDVAPQTQPLMVVSDDDIDHVHCCINHDVALCGKDLTGAPYVEVFTDPCVVCDELTPTWHCPVFGQCQEEAQ